MKRILSTLALIAITISYAWAQSFQSDGLYYNITDSENKTVEVTNDPQNNYDYIVGKLVIPETTIIDNETYTVTAIGEWAFVNCLNITEINLPEKITHIGYAAFDKCTNLENVYLNEGLTEIGEMAFEGCSALQEITLPKSLTTLSNMAFEGCSSIKDIVLPENITYIGDMAFNGCKSLTNITIPQNVTHIGDNAFDECTSLAEINVSPNNKTFTSENGILFDAGKSKLIQYPIGKSTTSYDIPNSVASIGNSAFTGCTTLEDINFSNNLTHIGDYAFYNCSALKNPVFPESLTDIGICAFSFCNSITEINLPQNIQNIGMLAFAGSAALESIYLPENNPNYSTEDGVLFNADKSTLLLFPAGKTSKNYTIPENVTTIGDGAFIYCPLITAITLPEGITTIGESAFADCAALTQMTVLASIPPKALQSSFDDSFRDIPIYVPTKAIEAYRSANVWMEFNLQTLDTRIQTAKLPECIQIGNRQLYNPNGLHLDIFDLQGRIVFNGTETTISLPEGIYIVRCKGMSYKVTISK